MDSKVLYCTTLQFDTIVKLRHSKKFAVRTFNATTVQFLVFRFFLKFFFRVCASRFVGVMTAIVHTLRWLSTHISQSAKSFERRNSTSFQENVVVNSVLMSH